MELKKEKTECQKVKEMELTVKKNWLVPPCWRARCTETNRQEREELETTHVPLGDWRTHCMMGRGRHPSPRHQTKEQWSVAKTHHCDGPPLRENEGCCESSNNVKRISNLHRGQTSEHHEQCCVEKKKESKSRGHLREWRDSLTCLVIVRSR